MLRRILLLCDGVERRFLGQMLRGQNAAIEVLHVGSAAELAAFAPAFLADCRLVGFCTPIIVPASILDALGHEAYNFHPGPPSYPGWMPAAFATYDGAGEFGATVHVMTERVDEGRIIGVDLFPVAPGTSRAELAQTTYLALLALFRRLARALAGHVPPLPGLPVEWSGRKTTRALFADLCTIPPDIDAAELARRLRAFGAGDGRSVPTVWMHGVPFRYAAGNEGSAQEKTPQDAKALSGQTDN